MKQNIKKNNQSVEKDAIKTAGFPSFEVFKQGLDKYLSGGRLMPRSSVQPRLETL